MPRHTARVDVKPTLSELAHVRAALAEFVAPLDVPSDVLLDVTLAVEEIITNVISYGLAGDHTQLIAVRLSFEAGVITVEVEDGGQPFDPLRVAAPDITRPLDEREAGGLGIHLVRSVMDDVAYARRDGRNVVLMRKAVR
jgi:anti-sigma regulatory factor (Ser/Thr protein kinase)